MCRLVSAYTTARLLHVRKGRIGAIPKFGQAPKNASTHITAKCLWFDQFNNYIYCLVSFIYVSSCFFLIEMPKRVCCASNANMCGIFFVSDCRMGPLVRLHILVWMVSQTGDNATEHMPWVWHRNFLLIYSFYIFGLSRNVSATENAAVLGSICIEIVNLCTSYWCNTNASNGTYLPVFIRARVDCVFFKRTTTDRGNFWCNLIMGKLVKDIAYYSADGLCGGVWGRAR